MANLASDAAMGGVIESGVLEPDRGDVRRLDALLGAKIGLQRHMASAARARPIQDSLRGVDVRLQHIAELLRVFLALRILARQWPRRLFEQAMRERVYEASAD